jgi:hypothetical protein
MYKFIQDWYHKTNRDDCIERISDKSVIPFDPANTDYQEYLKWVAEGNTPEAAE